jgi:hypothetical protein
MKGPTRARSWLLSTKVTSWSAGSASSTGISGLGEGGGVDALGPGDQLGVGGEVDGEAVAHGPDEEAGAAGAASSWNFWPVRSAAKWLAVAGQLEGAGVVVEVPGHRRVLAVAEVEADGRVGAGEVRGVVRVAGAVILGDVAELGGPRAGGRRRRTGPPRRRRRSTSRGGGRGLPCARRAYTRVAIAASPNPAFTARARGRPGWRTLVVNTPGSRTVAVVSVAGLGSKRRRQPVGAGAAGRSPAGGPGGGG